MRAREGIMSGAMVTLPPRRKPGRPKGEQMFELEKLVLKYGISIRAARLHRRILLNPDATVLAKRVIVNDIRRHMAGMTDEMFLAKRPHRELVITGSPFRALAKLTDRIARNGSHPTNRKNGAPWG